MLLSYLEDNARDLYCRFNVPQGMQQIMLDEWAKKDDIKTYTDKYLRLNQTEQELLDCVKRLRSSSSMISKIHPSSQRLISGKFYLLRASLLQPTLKTGV